MARERLAEASIIGPGNLAELTAWAAKQGLFFTASVPLYGKVRISIYEIPVGVKGPAIPGNTFPGLGDTEEAAARDAISCFRESKHRGCDTSIQVFPRNVRQIKRP